MIRNVNTPSENGVNAPGARRMTVSASWRLALPVLFLACALPVACATPKKPSDRFIRPKIQPAEFWGAKQVSGSFRSLSPAGVTLLEQPYTLLGTETSLLPSIYRLQQRHIEEYRWGDIGYHFLVLPTGELYAGRRAIMQGKCEGWEDPGQQLLVAVMGRYADHPLPPELQVSLFNLVGWLTQEYGISPEAIGTLRDRIGGDNPGENLDRFVRDGIRESLLARVKEPDAPGTVRDSPAFRKRGKKERDRIETIHEFSD